MQLVRGQLLRGVSAADRYGLVIATIFLNYVIAITVDGEAGSAWGLTAALVTIWLVFTVSEARRVRRIAALAVPVAAVTALALTLSRPGREETLLQDLLVLANLTLYVIAPVVIVRHIVGRPRADLQTMLAGIAAYLLIGMSFAYGYRIIGAVQQAPLFGEAGTASMPDVMFFSFVTLTTTGYGNLVPVANPGQTLAVLEMIIGQLFLVIAMARIVTAVRLPRRAAAVAGDNEPPED